MMHKQLIALIFPILFVTQALSQNLNDWKRYSFGTPDREGFSVLLPIVPKQIVNGEIIGWGISANINGISYYVTFKDNAINEFNKQKELFKKVKSENISVCEYEGIEFSSEKAVHRYFLIDERLYHIWVVGANLAKPNVSKFLESFTLLGNWIKWKGERANKGEFFEISEAPPVKPNNILSGDGNGSGSGVGTFEENLCNGIGRTIPLRILSRPQPELPEDAKQKGLKGTIRLRVTFLKNGTIGQISVVNGLSKELDEIAIEAAKQIKFSPQRVNGGLQNVTKYVEYSFR